MQLTEQQNRLPVTLPIINETAATPTANENKSIIDNEEHLKGFLKQNDALRLLELINSPPPIVPSSTEESVFKLSLGSSTSSLSEGLTNRQVRRRQNEYVKSRPMSRQMLDEVDNQLEQEPRQEQRHSNRLDSVDSSITGEGRSEPRVITAVIEHHETAL